MATSEIDSLIRDSRDVMCHVASSDSRLDELIRRGNALNGKLKHITEYQHCMDTVNSITTSGNRRAALLGELQLENKQILEYQEENRNLKESVQQCMTTLEIIMKKHRELSKRLESSGELPSLDTVLEVANVRYNYGEVQESTWKFVYDWLALMQKAEAKTNSHDAVVAQLKVENNVLREMLSNAEISNPGLISKFASLVAELTRNEETDCDDISDSEMNVSVIEVPKVE